MRRVWILLALALCAPTAWAQDCGGIGDDADCDRDGFTIGQGDCDDDNVDVRPGLPDLCGDQLDNNCDGIFDEACDRSAQLGGIRGGGGCSGGGATSAMLLMPLFFRRRRTA